MQRLKTTDPDFGKKFQRIVDDRRESGDNIARSVSDILEKVRNRGDEALQELTARYDNHFLTADLASWRISKDECEMAFLALDARLRDALELAAARIRAYHEKQGRPRKIILTPDSSHGTNPATAAMVG